MFVLATLVVSRQRVAAMRIAGRYWPVAAAARATGITGLEGDLESYFAGWRAAFPRLKRLASVIAAGKLKPRLAVAEGKARLATPVRPPKIICVGANYADHLAEMNASSIKKMPGVPPFFFLKPPSTVLSGPGPTVRMPRDCKNLDWEAEMVVVFGKGGKDITPERAMDHVAGYTLGIDFTARDLFSSPESFFKFNFVLGKCQDTLSPVGPAIVPAAFADGGDLPFSLSVNGVRKQSTSTRLMIYSLAEQIAGVSCGISIEAGDLMFTGSPAGVGLPRGEKLAIGDRVRVESEAIGAMEVVIQPPQ
ncbi:MAG: fumarylacetoacetate hydrolase family protein [Proteobacteria bacterium]|nr:fumarylacetoacetate hydrolase family protein [Pseudomonadota bacterium]